MTVDDLLEELRIRLDDTVSPYLWSDDELTKYLDKAHEEAAIRARLIEFDTQEDEDPAIDQIQVVTGTAAYAKDSRIIEIRRALYNGFLLVRTYETELDDLYGDDWRSEVGEPTHYIEKQSTVRLYPFPEEVLSDDPDPVPINAEILDLVGFRLPLGKLGESIQSPEIPLKDHANLMDWAAHLAYLRPDAETVNQKLADYYEAKFTKEYGERLTANQERKRHEARRKTVRYAGY